MDTKTAHQTAAANPRILILCDFDGTVSTKDTVNRLVREHTDLSGMAILREAVHARRDRLPRGVPGCGATHEDD